jgi:hypothetical protein
LIIIIKILKFHFYDFNSKPIQGNRQFETTTDYDVDYPEILSRDGGSGRNLLIFCLEITFILSPSYENVARIALASASNVRLDLRVVPLDLRFAIKSNIATSLKIY